VTIEIFSIVDIKHVGMTFLVVIIWIAIFCIAVCGMGHIFNAYECELMEKHLDIKVLFLGFIPLPGLKIAYGNIENIERAPLVDLDFKIRLPYYHILSLRNRMNVSLKKRVMLSKLLIIAPEEPDIFTIRLKAKIS
jgi:hypothetical protein